MSIDYSKYAHGTLTEEDLKNLASSQGENRFGFKENGWYRFRVTAQESGVSKAKDKNGNAKPDASGSMLIYETMHALNANDTLSTDTDDVRHIDVLFARTPPELLIEAGYNADQIAFVAKKGPSKTYEMMKQRLAAYAPDKVHGKKNEDGTWSLTDPQKLANVLAIQNALYAGAESFVGTEVYAKVYYETYNGYTNAKLKWFTSTTKPPREKDGTFSIIESPDKQEAPF